MEKSGIFEKMPKSQGMGFYVYRVPTDTGKPGKMRQLIPVMEKSGIFEKMPKSQGILNESGKSLGKLIHKLELNY